MDFKKECSKHFEHVNHFCDTLTLQMLKFMIAASTITSIVPSICSPIYCYLRDEYHIDPECLYAPYKQTYEQIQLQIRYETCVYAVLFKYFLYFSTIESSALWNENTLLGKSWSIVYCAMAVTIYTYVTAVFMTFFITSSLQFDAFRNYWKGLIDEFDKAIAQRLTDDDDDIKTMFQHIVCFHVAVKE